MSIVSFIASLGSTFYWTFIQAKVRAMGGIDDARSKKGLDKAKAASPHAKGFI